MLLIKKPYRRKCRIGRDFVLIERYAFKLSQVKPDNLDYNNFGK